MRLRFREFDQGLWFAGTADAAPQGTLRRAAGAHTIRSGEIRSRQGSVLIGTAPDGETINSATYFGGKYYFGTDAGKFYRVDSPTSSTLILSGFDGTPLRFLKAPPAPGIRDYLFICGGGDGLGPLKMDPEGNITRWGIPAPKDGFTVELAPQRSKLFAPTEDNMSWVKVREFGFTGPASPPTSELSPTAWKLSMKPASLSVYEIRVLPDGDLSRFDPTPQNPFPSSSDFDYIVFKINVDLPDQLDFIQIGLDIGPTVGTLRFISDFYTALLVVVPKGEATSPEITERTNTFTELLQERRRAFSVDRRGRIGPGFPEDVSGLPSVYTVNRVVVRKTKGEAEILPIFGTRDLRPDPNAWTTVKVPKAAFHRSGTNASLNWAHVHTVRLYFRTKEINPSTGGTIKENTVIHVDGISMVGGYGTKGKTYQHLITFYDERTGNRSNPNPTPVETQDVDRQAFLVKKLPFAGHPSIPSGVTHVELWRTYGDGADFYLSKRIHIEDLAADRSNPLLENYEGLLPGELFDDVPDVLDFNKRAPVPGSGTVSNSGNSPEVTFSDSIQGGKVRAGDALIISGEYYGVVGKPAANVATLDKPINLSVPSTFEWLATVVELGSLDARALGFDNAPPYATVDDTVFYAGRAWWTDPTPGRKGIIYFSLPGKPESMVDFRQLARDTELVVRMIPWNNSLWVFSQEKVYQIDGFNDPIVLQEIDGAPGTTRPRTVEATPKAIVYQAADAIRAFNGVTTEVVSPAIAPIFLGEDGPGIKAFDGTNAAQDEREYYITDGKTVLALELSTGLWREIRIPANYLVHIGEQEKLIASLGPKLLDLELAGAFDDDGDPILFEVETGAVVVPSGRLGIIQRIYLDMNTNGELLTATLVLDATEVELGPFSTLERKTVECSLLQNARVVGVRLSGQLKKPVFIYGIELDLYIPGES